MHREPPAASKAPQHHWRVAGASVRGASHVKRDLPCQDAHTARVLPGGALVIAVADGAGSAPRSELGAAWASVATADWVAELLREPWPTTGADWHALLVAALRTAHDTVVDTAKRHQVPLRDLATTLITVVATPHLAAAIQVGDGAAVVRTTGDTLITLTNPQSGEYINETTFFTSPDYLNAAEFALWEADLAGVAVLSDGLQLLSLQMPSGDPYPAFFLPLFQLLSEAADEREVKHQLRDLLQSDRITQRADDDLTLVLGSLIGHR